MTIAASGPISMSTIYTELGISTTNAKKLSNDLNFYFDGTRGTAVSLSSFRGKTNYLFKDKSILYLDASKTGSYSGSGSTWTDLSPQSLTSNKNDLTLYNCTYDSTIKSGVIKLNGSNSYAYLSTITGFNNSNFTIIMWVYIGNATDYVTAFSVVLMQLSRANNPNDADTEFIYRTDNFFDWTGSAGFNNSPSTRAPLIPAWYQMAFVKNGTSGAFYINGSANGTVTASLNATYGTNDFCIGRDLRDTGTSTYLNGNIGLVLVYTSSLTAANIKTNFDNLSSRFSLDLDGTTSVKAAPSAAHIKALTGTNTDGAYWINLPTVGATQIYCVMDSAYNGGGWMMAFKAAAGSTFQYNSAYWTTKSTSNVLNADKTNRDGGDAKFHTANYYDAKDWLAIFPYSTGVDGVPTSGGDITGITNSGWIWLEKNVVSTPKSIVQFFIDQGNTEVVKLSSITINQVTTNSTPTPLASTKYTSTIFSSQTNYQWYGFNHYYRTGTTTASVMPVRWGFIWNNEGVDEGSTDSFGGIGLGFYGASNTANFSAGDGWNSWSGVNTQSLRRSFRMEWYVR